MTLDEILRREGPMMQLSVAQLRGSNDTLSEESSDSDDDSIVIDHRYN